MTVACFKLLLATWHCYATSSLVPDHALLCQWLQLCHEDNLKFNLQRVEASWDLGAAGCLHPQVAMQQLGPASSNRGCCDGSSLKLPIKTRMVLGYQINWPWQPGAAALPLVWGSRGVWWGAWWAGREGGS